MLKTSLSYKIIMTMPAGWKPKEEDLIFGREETIWRNDIMKGIINRKIEQVQLITNMRVIQGNRVFKLSDLDDVIVMNQHRSSQGTRYYVGGFARTAYGMGQSKGRTIGDVVFIYQGKPVFIFRSIHDPHGLVKLAKAARKRLINAIKAANTIKDTNNKNSYQKNENKSFSIGSSISLNNMLICHKCGPKNTSVSNFCGICGNSLSSNCSKCGHFNPPESAFCNNCGYTLA